MDDDAMQQEHERLARERAEQEAAIRAERARLLKEAHNDAG